MKLVCLDTPYSKYFDDLASSLERGLNCNIEKEFLAINPEFHIYCRSFSRIPVLLKRNPSEYYISYVKGIKNLSNIDSEADYVQMAKVYVWLEEYVKCNSNAIFLLYNDMRWHHSFVIDLCKRYNLMFFVFERGVFRPYTTSFDCKGVNARSSFAERNFNGSVEFFSGDLDCIYKRNDHKSIKLMFFAFLLLKKFYSFLNKKKTTQDNRKGVFHYFKLFLKQRRINKTKASDCLNRPFFFVPLQLQEDTQIVFDSDFSSNQEFIHHVFKNFKESKFNKTHLLCFKSHPMDVRSYDFPMGSVITSLDSKILVESASAVITINSTVGFEAIGVCPVICMGDSFYTGHGLVKRLSKSDNIFINENFRYVSDYEKNSYLNFVLRNYQLPGSVYNYTDLDMNIVAEKIIERLKN